MELMALKIYWFDREVLKCFKSKYSCMEWCHLLLHPAHHLMWFYCKVNFNSVKLHLHTTITMYCKAKLNISFFSTLMTHSIHTYKSQTFLSWWPGKAKPWMKNVFILGVWYIFHELADILILSCHTNHS